MQQLTLIDWMAYTALRKSQVQAFVGVGAFLGMVLCCVLPVQYTATTTLMPPQQTQSSVGLLMSQFPSAGSSSLAALAGGGLGLKNPNDIYIGLLASRPIADALTDRFHLVIVYHSSDRTAARRSLAKATRIHSEKTGFITVSVTDRDPRRAADLANMYTEQLRLLTQKMAAAEALDRRVFYETQIRQAKQLLVQSETNFEQVQQKRGLVQLDAQAKAIVETLAALHTQITGAEVALQAQRSFSTNQNPSLVMAERELASLKTEAIQLEQRNNTSTSSGLGLRDLAGAGIEYLSAEHELKYRQAMFDLLIKQYDAAGLDELKSATIIQVVEPALAPERRSSPRRLLLLLLGTGVGLAAGLLLVSTQYWFHIAESNHLSN